MPKAIIFDFDGVIADSEPLHWRAFLRTVEPMHLHFSYQQYLEQYVGFDDRDAFRIMLRQLGRKDAEDPQQLMALVQRKGDMFEQVVAEGVTSFPGTIQFVKQAADHGPIAIASGATRRDIDLILGRLGLDQLFAAVVTADMVQRSKPDPETYLMALARLQTHQPALSLKPEDCVAIEDTAAGITAARRAGLWTLGLTTTGPASLVAQAHQVRANLEGLTWGQLQRWFG